MIIGVVWDKSSFAVNGTQMMRCFLSEAEDAYNIELLLRHPSLSRESIAHALSVELKGLCTAGDASNKPYLKRTLVSVPLEAGNGSEKFEAALIKVSKFLRSNTDYWIGFVNSGGEIDLILNHAISRADEAGDKCFELRIAPALLGQLAATGINLRVQGWQDALIS